MRKYQDEACCVKFKEYIQNVFYKFKKELIGHSLANLNFPKKFIDKWLIYIGGNPEEYYEDQSEEYDIINYCPFCGEKLNIKK